MRGIAGAFRPLPLSIAAMLALSVIKLVTLGQDLGPVLAGAGRVVLPSANAAAHDVPATPAAAVKPVEPVSQSAPLVGAAAPMNPSPPVDPGPSDAERALLLDLRARRAVLEAREKSLDSRDALLKATERKLSERVEQLTVMQSKLEALEQSRRERDEANWRGLVKTYEAMRPRDAAAILNELEQPVLMQVLDRMKEVKAAAILAAMPPDRARAATSQLAQWRNRTTGPG